MIWIIFQIFNTCTPSSSNCFSHFGMHMQAAVQVGFSYEKKSYIFNDSYSIMIWIIFQIFNTGTPSSSNCFSHFGMHMQAAVQVGFSYEKKATFSIIRTQLWFGLFSKFLTLAPRQAPTAFPTSGCTCRPLYR